MRSALFIAILGLLAQAVFAAGADEQPQTLWLVEFDGPLGPATSDLIVRSIAEAEAADAEAIIIRMNTPGGLDKAMRDIVKRILAAKIPVVTFVAPQGSRAASAGTYIAYASHIVAMAPATNIGSSTPVSIGGPAPKLPNSEDSDKEPDASTGADAMARKVVNDAVAYLQGLAELRGRNIEWAEATVRDGANLRASEALEQNVIDLITDDLDSLLADLDGRQVVVDGTTGALRTAGATVHIVETDWRHELLTIITDPTIAYGLLIFGIYGLILEFYNPGMVFPSVIGIVCLLLGAYGLQMLPVNYAGLALVVVGIGLMTAEVFTPTMGVLGVSGVAAFIFGSIILMDTEAPGFTLPLGVIGAFAASTAGLSLFVIGAAVRIRGKAIRTGAEAIIGSPALAEEDFADRGRVHAMGETWQAVTHTPVRRGDQLRISSRNGLTLTVEPASETDPSGNATNI